MEQFLPKPSRASLLRLLASVGLAVILWAWVTTLRDPETSRTFANVPVTAQDLAESLVIVERTTETQVRITGPESVIDGVQGSQVQASIDLEEITDPGSYMLDVVVDAPDDVWRARAQPAAVGVTVEEAKAEEFPVEVDVQDLDASSLRTVNVEPEVDRVVARGPSSAIARIDSVVLTLETAGGTRTYYTTLTPEPVDVDGVAVGGIEIEPATIDATVSVAARGKSVAVLVSTDGSTAPGFEVIDRTANPPSVIVDGPAEALDRLIAVSAEPVDISGASSSVSTTVEIVDLPEGVRVLQPQSGQVDVLIQIGQRGVRQVLTGLEVTATNVESGLDIEVNPASITIEVTAPEEVLSTLTVDSFRVVVDVSGLGAGEHTVEPMVIVPAQVQWISANPDTVQVLLSESGASP